MTEKCSRYEDAHPCDRWKLADGKSCWMTGQDCDVCGMPLATDGKAEWCTAATGYKNPKNSVLVFGSMWINDGESNRLIQGSELIPEGWKRGRIMKMVVAKADR